MTGVAEGPTGDGFMSCQALAEMGKAALTRGRWFMARG